MFQNTVVVEKVDEMERYGNNDPFETLTTTVVYMTK